MMFPASFWNAMCQRIYDRAQAAIADPVARFEHKVMHWRHWFNLTNGEKARLRCHAIRAPFKAPQIIPHVEGW